MDDGVRRIAELAGLDDDPVALAEVARQQRRRGGDDPNVSRTIPRILAWLERSLLRGERLRIEPWTLKFVTNSLTIPVEEHHPFAPVPVDALDFGSLSLGIVLDPGWISRLIGLELTAVKIAWVVVRHDEEISIGDVREALSSGMKFRVLEASDCEDQDAAQHPFVQSRDEPQVWTSPEGGYVPSILRANGLDLFGSCPGAAAPYAYSVSATLTTTWEPFDR